MEAVWVIVGVAIGAGIVYFAVVRTLQAKVAEIERAILEAATLKERLANLEENHASRIKAYEDAEKAMASSFDTISLKNLNAALEQHKKISEGDIAQRQRSIEEMLKPFSDRLKDLNEHNSEIEKSRAGAYGEMLTQIKTLGEQQTGLTKETTRLVKALQDPGSAGSWGEMVLERVVEIAGLTEHYSYNQQDTAKSDDGNQRPDMIVHLPGNRKLIIDSKAPMRAYLDGLETTDEEMRNAFFRTHAGKIFEHAKELKKRDYSKRDGASDFTVMFIPSESAFRTAVESRPSLIEECMDCNVVVATPTTLLALLRAVNYGWQQEKLAEYANEVQKDGAELYNRIGKLVEHYVKLGNAIKSAGTAYNEFGGTLEARVLPAARRFKDHGVQTNKELAVIEQVDINPRTFQSEELSTKALFVEHDANH